MQLERTSNFRLEVKVIVETVDLQAALYHLHHLWVGVDEPEPVGVPADEGAVVLRLYLHVVSVIVQL